MSEPQRRASTPPLVGIDIACDSPSELDARTGSRFRVRPDALVGDATVDGEAI
ncbi:hypothetical protein [Thauera humireducens]|uniref:hypothetical protein n=1 Tax=Thauera humireducens TaxID=1134435 RepID=UPI00311F5124